MGGEVPGFDMAGYAELSGLRGVRVEAARELGPSRMRRSRLIDPR